MCGFYQSPFPIQTVTNYHNFTHTLVIGKGHLDHTAVVDWYANEVKVLASRNQFAAAKQLRLNKTTKIQESGNL